MQQVLQEQLAVPENNHKKEPMNMNMLETENHPDGSQESSNDASEEDITGKKDFLWDLYFPIIHNHIVCMNHDLCYCKQT